MFRQIKTTAISIKPVPWEKARNADRLESFFRRAARKKPDLIVATEGALEGYVSHDVKKRLDKAGAMLEIAEPIDGPYIRRFCKLAKGLKTCLCFGFAERIGRAVYNSSIFIDHHGEIRGTYHKHEEPVLSPKGRGWVWTEKPMRRRLRAFDTPFGRCGLIVCADRWYAMLARTLVLDGAQYLVISAYGSKERPQNETVLARARENGVPIVEANVGANLIISRGEIVAFKWGVDRITTGVIDIPLPPSTTAARRYEREFLQKRGKEKWAWLPEEMRTFPKVGSPSDTPRSTVRKRGWDF